MPPTNASGEIVPGRPVLPAAGAQGGFVLPSNRALPPIPEAAGANANQAHTLAELIDIAQRSNPSTRIAWNAAREAALAVGLAQSTFLPRLTAVVVGGYRYGSGDDTTQLGRRAVSSQSDDNLTGGAAVLGLQWLIFDFGQRAALVDAAGQTAIAANVAFTAAHQQVIYDVTLAYYMNATARERVALLERSLANARAVQAAAEAAVQQGQGTVVEVAQARQATAQTELRLVQARGRAQDSHQTIVTATGLPPRAALRVATTARRPLPPNVDTLAEATMNEAVARRPDVLAAFARLRAAEAGITAARASFFPSFFATGNIAGTDGRLGISSLPAVGEMGTSTLNLSGRQFSSLILGGLAVPIYDGGVRSTTLRQAQARADSAGAALRRTRDDAVRDIVMAENALRTSVASHVAATILESAANTTFDAALASYRNGTGTLTAATVAQNGLLDARMAREDSYSAAQIAAAGLAFAMGMLRGGP
ncbi:TolC family protein [Neoroseomonas lacus]|uniref:Protein CyaE n=1 Tax=Neoroseomonas lacus TaxID=287609 RepID=A0A917KB03_9PROT|nr:TolC family protein [Neoroseomonas lacus]GGJ04964.1 protein CyaE [Neoroseomonas lacus]